MENIRIHISARQLIGATLACASLTLLFGLGVVRAEAASSHGCVPKHAKRIRASRDGEISGNMRSILITRRDRRNASGGGTYTSYYACQRSRHRSFVVERSMLVDSREVFVTAWAIHAPYIAYATEVDGPDYAYTYLKMMNVRTGEKMEIDSSDGTVPGDQGATYTIEASGISDCGAIAYEKNGASKTSQGFCNS